MGQAKLVVPQDEMRRGNFLTFETPQAQAIYRDLQELRVIADMRGQRLRLGFGLYQTEEETDELTRRLYEAGALESSSAA